MVQTDVKGEMGATLERMGGEEGIVPERSEWFRSRRIIGTYGGLEGLYIGCYFTGAARNENTSCKGVGSL